MFSGLFEKAPSLASKSGGGQGTDSKKQVAQQKKDLPIQQNDQAVKSTKKKKKRNGNDSKVPAGGIPMTEAEIADFQKWQVEQKSRSAKPEKDGKSAPTDQCSAPLADLSKNARKRARKKKNQHEPQNEEGKDSSGKSAPTDHSSAALADLSKKARKRGKKNKNKPKQVVEQGKVISATHPSSQSQKRKHEVDSKQEGLPLSKKAKKRLRQQKIEDRSLEKKCEEHVAPISAAASLSVAKGGAVSKAAARLQGSRFRWLNDTLYSISGEEALELYKKDPSLATAYHEGFREQVRKWPRNPLDDVIQWLKNDVPREKVVGDFGCGEAQLALELKGRTVHSFDLIKINERVTPCNLASVPLDDQTIDVAIFCLALMGTDWLLFLEEAHRCLRQGGILQIMEVESRMSDVNAMTRQVEAIGFSKLFVKPGNFFIEMRFKKSGSGKEKLANSKNKSNGSVLAGCTYRKR